MIAVSAFRKRRGRHFAPSPRVLTNTFPVVKVGNGQRLNFLGVQSSICGTTVRGNVVVNNNGWLFEIGTAAPQFCAGKTIRGLGVTNSSGPALLFKNKSAAFWAPPPTAAAGCRWQHRHQSFDMLGEHRCDSKRPQYGRPNSRTMSLRALTS